MLSKPYSGWTSVSIGNFKGSASYLTDVPLDCLLSFTNALKYSIPASICFDEEGSEFTLVTNTYNTYIISERETTELIKIDETLLSLSKELIKDIEDNLEDWIMWQNYYELTEDELMQRKNIICNKLKQIKDLVSVLDI